MRHFARIFLVAFGIFIGHMASGTDYPPPGTETSPDLHTAASSGNLKALRERIEEDQQDPEMTTKLGETPLHLAAKAGHPDIVRYLLRQACVNVHPKATKPKTRDDDRADTPLHFAVKYGWPEIVDLILEGTDKGSAEINQKSSDGNTPLSIALALAGTGCVTERHGYSEPGVPQLEHMTKIIRSLLDKGADPNIRLEVIEGGQSHLEVFLSPRESCYNHYEMQPIEQWQRVEDQTPQIIKMLINAGATIDKEEINRLDHLLWSIMSDYEELSELLKPNAVHDEVHNENDQESTQTKPGWGEYLRSIFSKLRLVPNLYNSQPRGESFPIAGCYSMAA
ncbi:MAG: ankyrin repeat domain-containing protein [Deltaproteobacteria bacterium]|nr:ankyrin repeat domain-containing protein [Deltaproteobacteria bacterium]